MNTAMVPHRGLRSQFRSAAVALLGAASMIFSGAATAESVDTELLILVDLSNGGLKKGEFSDLMGGYAEAMSSNQVLSAIASGQTGKIAVSMRFFGGSEANSIGIPWMTVSSAAQAQQFATRVRGLSEPGGGGYDYPAALADGVSSFGDETGSPVNNHESALQIIEVAGATHIGAGDSIAAFNAGVDQINAMTIGKHADKPNGVFEAYYASNVIGGAGSVVSASKIDGGIGVALSAHFSKTLGDAATQTTVPEPSAPLLLLTSMAVISVIRRKRIS